jgi:transposase
LLRQLYGRRSERLVEGRGQQHLDFGDDPGADPSIISAAQQEPVVEEVVVRRVKKVRRQRSEKLPTHVERRTERIEPRLPAGLRLEDCQLIGLDVVEHAEYQRGKLWVRRIEYPKYKLPTLVVAADSETHSLTPHELAGACEPILPNTDTTMAADPIEPGKSEPVAQDREETSASVEPSTSPDVPASAAVASARPVPPVVTAPAVLNSHGILQARRRPSLVEGGNFGFSIAAQVLFEKFGLHVPLYRQQDSLAQLGWSPNRSTLGLIVKNASELFVPLAELFRQRVLATDLLGTDDTPVTLLTPGVGDGSREARFWLYRGRQAAPYDVFAFTDRRSRAGPDQFLASFRGILSGDCYSGYVNIEQVTGGRIKFSACLGHARRYVFKARTQQPLLGSQMMAQFRQLYDIEDRGRTMADAQRLALRQAESVPVMKRLRELLDGELAQRVLPRTKFGEALGYLRNHWEAFQVYLQDARVPIDNNDVERDLRRIAVGRKNWLFVGSPEAGGRSATIFSIVASAHRHDLDVWEYLCDALEKLAEGRAAAGGDVNQIDPAILQSLLPDVWAQSHPESIRAFRTDEKEQRAAVRRFKRAERRRTRGQE